MDSDQSPLLISYAGSLSYYQPGNLEKKPIWNLLQEYFWTYRVDNINQNTRSGYFLFKAIQSLKKKGLINKSILQVHLWGMIEDGNKPQIREMGIEDIVTIEGYVNKQDSFKRLQKTNVLFLPLESTKSEQKPLFIPGKLFEYLKSEKPILTLAGQSDCTEIIEKSGLGIVCDPTDEKSIEEKIIFLIKNKSHLPLLFQTDQEYLKKFSFDHLTKNLVEIFDEVLR